jgi:hypothetical protein
MQVWRAEEEEEKKKQKQKTKKKKLKQESFVFLQFIYLFYLFYLFSFFISFVCFGGKVLLDRCVTPMPGLAPVEIVSGVAVTGYDLAADGQSVRVQLGASGHLECDVCPN